VRIARFVDLAACGSIFSDESTFVLRSEIYYRRHYETQHGDAQELQRECPGHSAEFSSVLLSCWTILDGKEPTEAEWGLFDNSVVALISTPAKVSKFLKNAFELGDTEQPESRRLPFLLLEHKAVCYNNRLVEITAENIWNETVFVKRPEFRDQKEYRFALPFSGGLPHHIEAYIFSRDPFKYLETCYANPAMSEESEESEEQRGTLLHILLKATGGYGHFQNKKIADFFGNPEIVF